MSANATARQIVTEVQRLIGEGVGAGAQVYTEDGILDAINRAFNICFTKFAWPQFRGWDTYSLDGSTGRITGTPFTEVDGIEDFLFITRDGEDAPLPMLAKNINPLSLTGDRVQCWTFIPVWDSEFDDKKLQFYPLEATTDLNILIRVNPGPFVFADTIRLDKDMLVSGSAWQALMGNDLNPGMAATQKEMMNARFEDITTALARNPIFVSGDQGIPNQFFMR